MLKFRTEIPSDRIAEGCVIGSAILDNSTIGLMFEFITDISEFTVPQARELWRHIIARWREKKPIDGALLRSDFASHRDSENMTKYMLNALNSTPSAANAVHYAKKVHEKTLEREIANLIQNAECVAFDKSLTLEEKLQKMTVLRDMPEMPREKLKISQLLNKYLTELKESTNSRLSTGFNDLDWIIDGFGAGEFILIAGLPSIGKTSLLLDFFIHSARVGNNPLFISLEMTTNAICERMIKNIARVESIDPANPEVVEVQNLIEKWPAQFVDRPQSRLDLLTLQIINEKNKNNIGICFVDYLQKIQTTGRDLIDKISKISNSLAALALELNLPIVAGCQLNRAPFGREEHRPKLSDLRGSGTLEQDAEVVVFIHRDDYFAEADSFDGRAEFIVSKNRHGRTGTANSIWLPEYFSFATPHWEYS